MAVHGTNQAISVFPMAKGISHDVPAKEKMENEQWRKIRSRVVSYVKGKRVYAL